MRIAPESRRLELGAKWNVFQKHFPFAPWSRPTEAEPRSERKNSLKWRSSTVRRPILRAGSCFARM